ncbi:type I toxin-antitoxin system toxin Ldr family protein [Escherichia coli]|nr:type I toxin-antitoxin system toxin Ldr family protein [Escherichia coli]
MLRGLYPWWHWLLERENPHDLAAPILAGIITAAIVGWWRNRK